MEHKHRRSKQSGDRNHFRPRTKTFFLQINVIMKRILKTIPSKWSSENQGYNLRKPSDLF